MKIYRLVIIALAVFGLMACGTPGEVEQAANEALATATALVPADAEQTAEAVLGDATAQALVDEALSTAATALADPALQTELDNAFSSLNDQVTIQQGEALTLEALSAVANITNYKMTVVSAPEGAAASEGQVIKEASEGNISLNPDEYNQYFTVPGDYRVRLDITTNNTNTASHEFTITVP